MSESGAGGAIVKSGVAATDVPKGQMEENARNAETLFESRKVDEIRDVEKRTIKEAEDKEEELRRGAGRLRCMACPPFFIMFSPAFSAVYHTQKNTTASSSGSLSSFHPSASPGPPSVHTCPQRVRAALHRSPNLFHAFI